MRPALRLFPFLTLAMAFAAPDAHADWATGGQPVCVAAEEQRQPAIAPDGAGGAFIAWMDLGFSRAGYYVQRVLGNGLIAPGWPANGLRISPPHIALGTPDIAADG